MIYYFTLPLFLLVIGFLGFYSFYLLFNSGGSILYQNVAYSGLLGLSLSVLTFMNYLNHMFKLELNFNFQFYSKILLVVFTFVLFRIWEIRHNQLSRQNYKGLVALVSIINIILIINSEYNYVLIINELISTQLPIVLNIVMLGVVNVLFIRYNNLSRGGYFTVFPLTILIINLLNLGLLIINFDAMHPLIYFVFLLLQSIAILLMVKMCINDFKKSFYY